MDPMPDGLKFGNRERDLPAEPVTGGVAAQVLQVLQFGLEGVVYGLEFFVHVHGQLLSMGEAVRMGGSAWCHLSISTESRAVGVAPAVKSTAARMYRLARFSCMM